jgi:hypothetical protein
MRGKKRLAAVCPPNPPFVHLLVMGASIAFTGWPFLSILRKAREFDAQSSA